MNVKFLSLVWMFFSAMSGMATDEEAKTKSINVKPKGKQLQFTVSALKDIYAIDEPIEFRIWADHDFYLYIFNINDRTKNSIRLMPNQISESNFYTGKKVHLIPGDVEFVGDKTGKERVVFIASKIKLNWDMANYHQLGPFLEGRADHTEAQVKSIVVRNKGRKDIPVVREVEIRVKGGKQTAAISIEHFPMEAPPVPLQTPARRDAATTAPAFPIVAADKTSYATGEELRISMGADRDGFLHLFLLEEHQIPTVLGKMTIRANQINYINGKTEGIGRHTLLAVYSHIPQRSTLNLLPKHYAATKGLNLQPTQNLPYAQFVFEVHE